MVFPVSRVDLGRTWANLGTQKGPQWSPKARQDGAKKEKKSEVKFREVYRVSHSSKKQGFKIAKNSKHSNVHKVLTLATGASAPVAR